MKRLVSALYNDFHPFDNLPFISSTECVHHPEELTENDILIVHGGGDIHPSLYGKGRSSKTWCGHWPSHRDLAEWELMRRAKELKVPIFGICRGGQMLCALAGGYLIQHVNNHGGMHAVRTNDGQELVVNSIHHQMMQPQGTKHELVMWTTEKRSDVYYDEDRLVDVECEPEMVYFNDINGFAFQWHPEMLSERHPANRYILNYIQEKLHVAG